MIDLLDVMTRLPRIGVARRMQRVKLLNEIDIIVLIATIERNSLFDFIDEDQIVALDSLRVPSHDIDLIELGRSMRVKRTATGQRLVRACARRAGWWLAGGRCRAVWRRCGGRGFSAELDPEQVRKARARRRRGGVRRSVHGGHRAARHPGAWQYLSHLRRGHWRRA